MPRHSGFSVQTVSELAPLEADPASWRHGWAALAAPARLKQPRAAAAGHAGRRRMAGEGA
jgi:hypothetical protein